MQKYLKLNDIDAYKRSLLLSKYVWDLVITWEWFAKKSVGVQYVRAADSISATIAEGFGRYFKKDKVLFYRYALGSVTESLDWTQKAKMRKLFSEKDYEYILAELQKLPKEIYQLINFTNEKLNK